MPPARLSRLAREPTFISSQAPTVAKDGMASAGTLAAPTPSLFWAFGGFPASTGVPVSPFTAVQHSTVYSCVKARSEDLAKVPLLLKRRTAGDGSAPVRDHPLIPLLDRPNEWMNAFTFKMFVETSLCFRGNAYVVIKRDRAGTPQQLIPVHPDTSFPFISKAGTLFYRVTHPLLSPDGQPIIFHSDDVLHVKNFSLDAGYVGLSPIAAAQEAIGLALAVQQHGAILFRQGAQLSGIIQHPGALSDQAKDRISQSFGDKFQGVQNAHKVAVFEEGMKFEKIQMTQEDAEFLATRQFSRSEICGVFRTPPHKVQDLSGSTYSNMEVAEQSYINDALMPDATQMAEECRQKLLFDDERDSLFFDWHWDALLRADIKTRYEAYSIGLNNGFLSVNDVRDREGLNHVPNGDEYNKPLNIGQTGAAGTPPTGMPGDMAPNPTPKPAAAPAA